MHALEVANVRAAWENIVNDEVDVSRLLPRPMRHISVAARGCDIATLTRIEHMGYRVG